MKELIFGGLLYLMGVVIVLLARPGLMFTEEGQWKEFGIGRNPRTHTWMPFWLFCILWALLSYAGVALFIRTISGQSEAEMTMMPPSPNRRRRGLRSAFAPATQWGDFQPGYYVLNKAATGRKGVPQYVYYGNPPDITEY
jgi:membrane protease YdiL (CAAX protease family)